MISAESKPGESERFFVVQPNASLTKHGAIVVFAVVVLISLLVLLRFVLLGAWVVVPFTVLEVAFIGYILRLVLKSNRQVEMISINEHEIRVIKLGGSERTEWNFNPHWAQVELKKSHHNWYPNKLTIRSHGRVVELASCLTNSEREELAEALQESVFQVGARQLISEEDSKC